LETLGVGIEAGELAAGVPAGMFMLDGILILGTPLGIDMTGMFMLDGTLILGTLLGIGIDIDIDMAGTSTLSPEVPGSSVRSTSC
jgi:hypothetical protein